MKLSRLILPVTCFFVWLWPTYAPLYASPQIQSTDLPSMGDSSGQVISPLEEKRLGAAFMRQLRQDGLIKDDREIADYLESLGQRLATNSEIPGLSFTFFLVDEPGINAFAAPGGYIGVHAGLFLAAETESELAGVLAHEIAHVTQRHLARAFEASDRLSLPSAAALLAAILIGTQNSEAGQAAVAAVTAGSLQYQINFTRANEKEADRVGIQTLVEAGFDPFGMPRFFDRLQKNSRLFGSQPPEFLSTHPVTTDRIAEAISRAERFPASKPGDSVSFQLMRAKLRVDQYDNPKQVLSDFQRYESTVDRDTPVRRYEYALLLAASGDSSEARQLLEHLHKDDPDRIAYRLALGEVYLKAGQYTPALRIYRETADLYPGYLTVIAPYCSALIAAGQASDAYALLSGFTKKDQNDPQVFELLAHAAEATGRTVQSHTAMAQHYHLDGYTRKAIEQLNLASRKPGLTDYESARIQARLKELEALLEDENRSN